MKFTDRYIMNLKPKDKMYQQREAGGFGIRVLPTGHRNWIFTYTFDGVRRQMNLGVYPDVSLADARTAYSGAYSILHDKQNPRDPQAERDQRHHNERQVREEHRKASTVADLVNEYIEKHAKLKKTSWMEDKRILDKDVLPVWSNRKAKEITRRDVLLLLDGMQGRGNGITTNTFKIIRRMFTFAVKKEIITVSPCYAFEKGEELPTVSSRERTLTEDEIKVFWSGLDTTAISHDIRRILKMILLTGQRPGEVASMHRKEINGRWWEFTPKETTITKEIPRAQRIYLTDTALELIGQADDSGYVFKGNTDDTRHITERAISHALRRNLLGYEPKKKATDGSTPTTSSKNKKQFVVAEDKKMNIAHFTPHDARRTCATMMSQIGFADATVDAVLAHLKKGEIRTYNKNKYDNEKQQALEEWELKLNTIITGAEYRTPDQRKDDKKAADETDTAADKQRELEAQIHELKEQLLEVQSREAKSTTAESNIVNINQGRRKAA